MLGREMAEMFPNLKYLALRTIRLKPTRTYLDIALRYPKLEAAPLTRSSSTTLTAPEPIIRTSMLRCTPLRRSRHSCLMKCVLASRPPSEVPRGGREGRHGQEVGRALGGCHEKNIERKKTYFGHAPIAMLIQSNLHTFCSPPSG